MLFRYTAFVFVTLFSTSLFAESVPVEHLYWTQLDANGNFETYFDTDGRQKFSLALGDDVVVMAAGRDASNNHYSAALRNSTSLLVQKVTSTGLVLFIKPVPTIDGLTAPKIHDIEPLSNGGFYALYEGTVSGTNTQKYYVLKFNDTGALDTSYQTSGKRFLYDDASREARGMVAMSNGRLGICVQRGPTGLGLDVIESGGGWDLSFSGDGKSSGVVLDTIGSSYMTVVQCQVKSNGRVVVAATTVNGSGSSRIGLVQFLSDNCSGYCFDTSFSGDGKLIFDDNNQTTEVVRAMVIESNNNIVIAGDTKEDSTAQLFLLKIDPNGLNYIPTFGFPRTSAGNRMGVVKQGFDAVAVDSAGRVYAVITDSINHVVKYSATGVRDTAWADAGHDGKRWFGTNYPPNSTYNCEAFQLTIDSNDDLTVYSRQMCQVPPNRYNNRYGCY